jgi:hypothetical protein
MDLEEQKKNPLWVMGAGLIGIAFLAVVVVAGILAAFGCTVKYAGDGSWGFRTIAGYEFYQVSPDEGVEWEADMQPLVDYIVQLRSEPPVIPEDPGAPVDETPIE